MELQERPYTPTGRLLHDKSGPAPGVAGIDDPSTHIPPQAPTIWQKIAKNAWLWECICGVAIIGALAALIGIFIDAEGQSLEAWRHAHSNVSINAVIAIITTLLKGTSMLIVAEVIGQTKWSWFETTRLLRDFNRLDSASRGPLGSVKMLHWYQGPKLALLGAILTVLALAVDPFAQNIISTRTCVANSTVIDNLVTMPVADRYSRIEGGAIRPMPNAFGLWGPFTVQLDYSMKAAIYGGLFASVSTATKGSEVRVSCPGADCTFPRYNTLSVCHKCEDITSMIEKTCNEDTTLTDFQSRCKWSLPSGQFLEDHLNPDQIYSIMNGNLSETERTFITANATTSTIALEHIPGTFSNVTILANVSTVAGCTILTPNDCEDQPIGIPAIEFKTIAVECSLFPCARTYTAKTIDGLVVEEEVERTTGKGDWLRPAWHGQSPGDVVIDTGEGCTGEACVVTADYSLMAASANFFWHFWNGTISGRTFRMAASDNEPLSVMYNDGFSNFTYIDKVFGAISDSMTSAIRLTGRLGDESLPPWTADEQGIGGQVHVSDCITIRWGWFALPAAVGLLSLVLLVITVISVARTPTKGAWKSSLLPVLFHGLSAEGRRHEGQLSTLAEMDKEARSLHVRFAERQTGSLELKPTIAQ